MSDYTFSPGPWAVESGTIIDARRNIVATRHSWRHMEHGDTVSAPKYVADAAINPVEADMNARLIARAPEMFDLLRDCLPILRAVAANDQEGSAYVAWQEAEAIIAAVTA